MIEITDAGPITAHGATDTYEELDLVFPADVRERIADLALRLAREVDPGITPDNLLVSGFSAEPTDESLAATDDFKLSVQSRAPKFGYFDDEDETGASHDDFEGDDSNQANIQERVIQAIRDMKLNLARDLQRQEEEGTLTPTERQTAIARLAELDQEIAALRSEALENLPVYYATTHEGLLSDDPEYNPLAYLGEVPGEGFLGLYDRRSLEAAGIPITTKHIDQVRIATSGLVLKRHSLGVIRIQVVEA